MGLASGDRQKFMEEAFRSLAREAERRSREESFRTALKAVAQNDRDPAAYIHAARCAKQLGRLRETLRILEQGIARCEPDPALHSYLIERLEKCNRTEAAISAAGRAAALFPDQMIFRLQESLLLPVLYKSTEQLEFYRARFLGGLQRLEADPTRGLSALSSHVNKYLGYQGRNDRDPQMTYGNWAYATMAANYPQWTQRREMPSFATDGRLRVGFLSSRFRDCSVPRAFLGWMRGLDPVEFAVFGYHVGQREDAITDEVAKACAEFRRLPRTVEGSATAVTADDLHVLVFLDVGMDPLMTQLAALRLAPVQCAAWDYPITTGLPTVDYFLSGDLNEPADAGEHYSETLVRLPGIGLCYDKPAPPAARIPKTRADWGLREGATVYLSCQTIFKYLPKQDAMFAEIACQVPNSQLVFLVTNELVREDFQERLEGAFAAVGVGVDDRCLLLPEVSAADYWSLLGCSDVYLDTIGWSGAISTLDAVAAEIAIVTLEGPEMRGRQTAAILRQLGATETIARDGGEYIAIAVELGRDEERRRDAVARMVEGFPQLWGDTRCVQALEEFFRQAVSSQRGGCRVSKLAASDGTGNIARREAVEVGDHSTQLRSAE